MAVLAIIYGPPLQLSVPLFMSVPSSSKNLLFRSLLYDRDNGVNNKKQSLDEQCHVEANTEPRSTPGIPDCVVKARCEEQHQESPIVSL